MCRISLVAADRIRLNGIFHPGRRNADGLGFAVVHGFTNHVGKPAVRRILHHFGQCAPTVGVDFRGHGRSGGKTTVGADEVIDLDAAVGFLRERGCHRVVTVGFSLGGSVVIRQAALSEHAPDAAVAVSSPARWWVRDTAAMRRVHWLLEHPAGRLAARLLGVRLGPEWREVPRSPIELVSQVRIPLLLVHGAEDHYFPPAEAVALSEAGNGELWLVPGMRHAESSVTPDLADRIMRWARDTVAMTDPGRG
ncbi:alpha/beta hydrolase family protein [Saccharopolyspora rectivirgula]|uniref:alpha/beta hydrolase family protein n=1 Tax=Saccharopolyspora rectivirgula TaxID=28042 RepID=UPI002409D513|nr:alpha/beta fold hydrolase [Saccharopolyspora rectivirgula]